MRREAAEEAGVSEELLLSLPPAEPGAVIKANRARRGAPFNFRRYADLRIARRHAVGRHWLAFVRPCFCRHGRCPNPCLSLHGG